MNHFSLEYHTKLIKRRLYSCWSTVGIVSCCLLSVTPVGAQQITEDGTLSTKVTSPDGLNYTISIGELRGGNLFHSFSQFSIPTGGSAFFDNAFDIENIIGRVTGGSISNIDGLIRTNGTANLFLINPSGIIFGPNAQLDIGGSFVGSTANGLNFADGTQFLATNASSPPLLTISVPIGLQYGSNAGVIQVQGSSLAVQPDRTLALVGGDIAIAGGNLTAESGRIDLAAVAGPGTVGLRVAGNQIQLSTPENMARADILLTNGAFADTSGIGGGDIQLTGSRIKIEDSRVESTTLGSEPGGILTVNATDALELRGNDAGGQFSSGLFAETESSGAAGSINITTGQLTVQGEARVSAATFGAGAGGNLTVNAAESVELIGTDPPADDNSGLLFTGILTDAESTGTAGNLTINTARLIVRDGAQISAATFGSGAGGNLTVNATESIKLIGVSPSDLLPSGLFTAVQPTATGNGGNLEVNTRQLIVQDGAQIFAGTAGAGDGGNLTVNASDSIELTGVSPIVLFPSGLFSTADDFLVKDMGLTVGNAGDVIVNTRQLIVRDGAKVEAASIGNTGRGGNVTVNSSESVLVSGKAPEGAPGGIGGILANASQGAADSGTVRINTGQLTVRDGAQVAVSNQGSGNAGNLEVQARSIFLNRGTLTAETASGEGGNIKLESQELLLMRNNSLISAEARGTGNGGNIEMNTPFLVAPENSDTVANAEGGFGGRVIIKTRGIFKTQVRRTLTPESDITASSARGPEFDGVVEILTPDTDPSKELVPLSDDVVDATNLVAQGCGAGLVAQASRFIVSGRGGLAPQPGGTLPSEAVLEDLGTAPIQTARNSSRPSNSNNPTVSARKPIVEAQGWVKTPDGQVILTAQVPTLTVYSFWQPTAVCSAR